MHKIFCCPEDNPQYALLVKEKHHGCAKKYGLYGYNKEQDECIIKEKVLKTWQAYKYVAPIKNYFHDNIQNPEVDVTNKESVLHYKTEIWARIDGAKSLLNLIHTLGTDSTMD